jgi:tRNA and rRNA cytosine-C5-methylases
VKNFEIPAKFIDYLIEAAGSRIAATVLKAIRSGTPEVSIRINPMKVSDPAALDLPLAEHIPWCKDGYYLSKRPNFTLDPALHAGAYYVQEPSSMSLSVLEPIFRDLRPREILDLCAAPGGKSTHIISMAMRHSSVYSSSHSSFHLTAHSSDHSSANSSDHLSDHSSANSSNHLSDHLTAHSSDHSSANSSDYLSDHSSSLLSEIAGNNLSFVNNPQDIYLPRITCNEVIKSRAAILNENVTKWGVNSVNVTSKDPENFAREGSTFDLILVDAPCSGEGMFRKDPDAISEWSEENVKLCAARQRRILSDIWDALVPGGILIYSTCTFNKYENDDNLRWLKSEIGACSFSFFNAQELESSGVVITPEGGFQFFPGVVRGEGFYFAVVRKPFDKNGEFTVFPERERFLGVNSEKVNSEKVNSDKLRVNREKGVSDKLKVKSEKGRGEKYRNGEKDWKKQFDKKRDFSQNPLNTIPELPEHQLALSVNYEYEHDWPSVELSKEDALKYLSRNTINLDKNAPKGYFRVTYKGLGLGFVKNLGSRANNLYPMNWRIRKFSGTDFSN